MGINAELVKYAPIFILAQIAILLNNIFSNHVDIDTGDGELVVLPKPPPKETGLVANLRPITLLPIIRKILSKITLERCTPHFNNFLPQSQHAYRNSKSTTDVVWMCRMICAKAIKYDITVYVTGIDMTSAFDTIDRSKLLNITKYIVTEDEQRMLRVLLSNTKLNVRV